MRESAIEKWMKRKIEEKGGRFYKWVSPGCRGVPDRIMIMPGGRIAFVELKADHGRLSRIQARMHGILRRLGCMVYVVRGMDEAKAFMKALGGGEEDEVRATRISGAGD